MKILLTNDDGYKSPFLKIIADYFLAKDNQVSICVPQKEQSWKAKSMTRFGEINIEELKYNNLDLTALDGTPADCSNIGIHHVCDSVPDLVISGINIGTNASLSFALASGTLGASFEANLANIPSIAFSWQLKREDYYSWCEKSEIESSQVKNYNSMFLKSIDSILSYIKEDKDFKTKKNITWSVNLPLELTNDSKIKNTSLAPFSYGSVFKKSKKAYIHSVDFNLPELEDDSDLNCLKNGNISVTKLNIKNIATKS